MPGIWGQEGPRRPLSPHPQVRLSAVNANRPHKGALKAPPGGAGGWRRRRSPLMWLRWRVVTPGSVPSLLPATLSSRRGLASCRELRPDGSCWEKGEGPPPPRQGQGCGHPGTRPGGPRTSPARGGTGESPDPTPAPKFGGSQAHLGLVPSTSGGCSGTSGGPETSGRGPKDIWGVLWDIWEGAQA